MCNRPFLGGLEWCSLFSTKLVNMDSLDWIKYYQCRRKAKMIGGPTWSKCTSTTQILIEKTLTRGDNLRSAKLLGGSMAPLPHPHPRELRPWLCSSELHRLKSFRSYYCYFHYRIYFSGSSIYKPTRVGIGGMPSRRTAPRWTMLAP